mmetsp:Transcript_71595/g.232776  ORF Transcript_71595/g.232776 Transcript_71595/m.232776 type:complete len:223 (+) Transcript_71595:655-1323(+)
MAVRHVGPFPQMLQGLLLGLLEPDCDRVLRLGHPVIQGQRQLGSVGRPPGNNRHRDALSLQLPVEGLRRLHVKRVVRSCVRHQKALVISLRCNVGSYLNATHDDDAADLPSEQLGVLPQQVPSIAHSAENHEREEPILCLLELPHEQLDAARQHLLVCGHVAHVELVIVAMERSHRGANSDLNMVQTQLIQGALRQLSPRKGRVEGCDEAFAAGQVPLVQAL